MDFKISHNPAPPISLTSFPTTAPFIYYFLVNVTQYLGINYSLFRKIFTWPILSHYLGLRTNVISSERLPLTTSSHIIALPPPITLHPIIPTNFIHSTYHYLKLFQLSIYLISCLLSIFTQENVSSMGQASFYFYCGIPRAYNSV